MAQYHGDIMHKVGNVYTRADDRNYAVAIMLLVTLGPIGIHRFYLNDMGIALCYFIPFSISMLMGAAMLDFTLAVWVVGLSIPFLIAEAAYFAYRFVNR